MRSQFNLVVLGGALALGVISASLFVTPVSSAGGDQAALLKVEAVTADAVTFGVTLNQTTYSQNEDIFLTVRVVNNSKRPIDLVLPADTHVLREGDSQTLRVISSIQYPDAHRPCDCSLIRVAPQKSVTRRISIKGRDIPPSPKVEAETWSLQVELSYMPDVSRSVDDIRQCRNTMQSVVCQRRIFDLSKSLTVGSLPVTTRQIASLTR